MARDADVLQKLDALRQERDRLASELQVYAPGFRYHDVLAANAQMSETLGMQHRERKNMEQEMQALLAENQRLSSERQHLLAETETARAELLSARGDVERISRLLEERERASAASAEALEKRAAAELAEHRAELERCAARGREAAKEACKLRAQCRGFDAVSKAHKDLMAAFSVAKKELETKSRMLERLEKQAKREDSDAAQALRTLSSAKESAAKLEAANARAAHLAGSVAALEQMLAAAVREKDTWMLNASEAAVDLARRSRSERSQRAVEVHVEAVAGLLHEHGSALLGPVLGDGGTMDALFGGPHPLQAALRLWRADLKERFAQYVRRSGDADAQATLRFFGHMATDLYDAFMRNGDGMLLRLLRPVRGVLLTMPASAKQQRAVEACACAEACAEGIREEMRRCFPRSVLDEMTRVL